MLLRRVVFALSASILAIGVSSCSGTQSSPSLPATTNAVSGTPSSAIPGMPDELLQKLQEAHNGPVTDPGFLPNITPLNLKDPTLLQHAARQGATARGFSTATAVAAGGTINLGGVISLGPYAAVGNGCNSINSTATLTGITALSLLSTGAVQSTILNINNASLNGTSGYTNIANINLLGGLIKADTIQAVSFSYAPTTGPVVSQDFDTAGHQTSFVNLKVAGNTVLNVKPNTVISLAGLGSVTLDEEQPFSGGGDTALTVTAIHVRVTVAGNPFGLPVGADIYIARAHSAFITNTPPISLTGGALGPVAFLFVGGILTGQIGPTSSTGIACTGGSAHASAATVLFPNILTAGLSTQDGTGLYKNNEGFAAGQTSLAQVNVLSSLLVLTALQGNAYANSAGGLVGTTTITGGIAGIIKLPTNPAPNTTITIPLVATITMNEQVKITGPGRSEIVVVPIDIKLLNPNGPLKTGAHIYLGIAIAGTQTF